MKIKLLLLLFLSLFCFNSCFGIEEKKVVRVAISNQNFSNYDWEMIKISSSDVIKIIDMSQGTQLNPIEPNSIVEIFVKDETYNININGATVYKNLSLPLLISSNSELQILELNRKGTPARYKGMIEIRASKNPFKFNIINVIDMQNYLRGVVPNEMPQSFGLEALKAQSVAARNYAQNAQISPYYDVVDSTASQVYYGTNSYSETADLAVLKTNGIYALYDEKPITALYFSTSPGITDDWDDVFAVSSNKGLHPYLKSRCDLENETLKDEKDVIEFYSKKDNGLDIKSPKFRWEMEFERTELEEILNKTLLAQSKVNMVTPKFEQGDKIEGLKEIKPTKRTQSGKIIEIEIITKNEKYTVNTQLAIRRVLKKNNSMLPSTNFFIIPSKKQEKVDLLEVSDVQEDKKIKLFGSIDEEKYPHSFKFIGGGYGHNVGMSQYGASRLANLGKKYPEILNHYYSDIKIATIPKIVEFNHFDVTSKTEFYFEPDVYKNVYLFINNQKNVEQFPFRINEYTFSDTSSISNEKVLKINITKYLKEGLNTIIFAPLSRENRNKNIVYRVEFQE